MDGEHILVFPAASKPSIRIRISFVPKIFPIILDTCPPILAEVDAVSGDQELFGVGISTMAGRVLEE